MRTILLFALFILSDSVFAQKASDDFTGKWKAPKGAIIIVSKTKEGFLGHTESEKALVLKDVKYINNKWTGIVMNPKENLVAKCELFLEANAIRIIAKKAGFHRTIIWTKQ
jgi:uncharacterized protein (DUF2147 family)